MAGSSLRSSFQSLVTIATLFAHIGSRGGVGVDARRDSGTLDPAVGSASCSSAFAGKFCFDTGRLTVQVKQAKHGKEKDLKHTGGVYVVAFENEGRRWDEIRLFLDFMPCHEKFRYAKHLKKFAPPTTSEATEQVSIEVHGGTNPPFWYFMLLANGTAAKEPVPYSWHAVNFDGEREIEFGIDEKSRPMLDGMAFVVFLAMLITVYKGAYESLGEERLESRPVLLLHLISCGCSAVGGFLYMISDFRIAWSGRENDVAQLGGLMFTALGKAVISVVLLLALNGVALLRSAPEVLRRRKVSRILIMFGLTSIVLELLGCYAGNRIEGIHHIYGTRAGVVLLLLNFLTGLAAWRCGARRAPGVEKVRLYYAAIAVAFSAYFVLLPMACCLAMVALSPEEQFSFLSSSEIALRFVASGLMGICLKPARHDGFVNSMPQGRQRASLSSVNATELSNPLASANLEEAQHGGFGEPPSGVPNNMCVEGPVAPHLNADRVDWNALDQAMYAAEVANSRSAPSQSEGI
eukprot:TRINITY_DN60890_c0_g1_i1.p1 TRINITY_DN60890_c0_g1~~TRINITY_DN60890_c0_g1_i1.p1  ORF type:complete len:520 (+),score=90.10 TRINITY_DN60890_c0_g1_i1:176-1735(+)